jgi:cytochrome bd-type quinol oxidase subunit 1
MTCYYVIGFAVTGFLMLIFTAMTFAGISPTMRDPRVQDPWNMVVLTLAMILPFVVSTLSWCEWGDFRRQRPK